MDTRTLLAIVLSAAVIIGYQYFFASQPQPQAPQQQQPAPAEKKAEAPQPSAVMPAETAGAPEREIRVDTPLYRAVLTSRGGTITSWVLRSHKDRKGNDVRLLEKPGVLPPLAAGTTAEFDLAHANFSVRGGDLVLDSGKNSGSVVFEYSPGGQQALKRTYTFHADSYHVGIEDEVSGLPGYWITLGADFGISEQEDAEHHGPVILTGGTDLKELGAKDLKEPRLFKENVNWIAQEGKYFFSALVPGTPIEEARGWMYRDTPVLAIRGKQGTNTLTLYAGPKEIERLKPLKMGLEHIINFGFFSIIARPIFWILKFFHHFLGNYGWAIIMVTIVTRIPFIPLMTKQQQSMKKMAEIQPKMAEIRERYKKDPQKMQREMTELYKKHKVNPLGGCLPMLLQIPVFFALYKVLLIAIELRGAPFMLWITDLSVKDPYYVLPIIMGLTMVIQQKMTPSTMDPKQAKMMMMMPVVFTFMFLNLASGLVLYWLIGNILGIIQQLFINRKLSGQAAA